MDLLEFKNFLIKFNLNESEIEKIIKNKTIETINNNLFFKKINNTDSNDKNNNNIQKLIFQELLIFIKLAKLLPSKYLLELIEKNSQNIIELKNEKLAVNFTYGKSISLESIKTQIRFKKDKYYILKYDSKILGYIEFNNKNKDLPLKNIMNIGEYLKEE